METETPTSPPATVGQVDAGTSGRSGQGDSPVYGRILKVYTGSSGDATKALYAELETRGPAGLVAMNLFRAQKCSERAKVYRGRQYKNEAYSRKQWSMANLCAILEKHAAGLGYVWGWKMDPLQEFFPWVLYVDTPAGQLSFHSRERGRGPEYAGDWDQSKGTGPGRVVKLAWAILENEPAKTA